MGGPSAFGIYMFSLCTGISLYLPIIWLFQMGAIDCIVKCRVHSVLEQFQMGGVHLPLVSTCFLYALVFPYIFLLFDCFEWALIDHIEKRRGHSVLWQFQMGGSIGRFTLNLTVSNGHSLTILKSIEVTQHSGSFKWGGSIGRFSLNLPDLSSFQVLLLLHRALSFL